MATPDDGDPRYERIASLLQEHKRELLRDWEQRVLADPRLPEANRLSAPELRDHLPRFVDRLVRAVKTRELGDVSASDRGGGPEAVAHAHERHGERYSLSSAIREWSHFRRALRKLYREASIDCPDAVSSFLDQVIDEAIETVASEMYAAHDVEVHNEVRMAARRLAELEAIVASMPEAVVIGGSTWMANRLARELLGIGEDEPLREGLERVRDRVELRDPESDAPVAVEALGWLRAAAGVRVERDVTLLPAGSRDARVLHTSMSPIVMPAGEVVGVVALASDVTDHHRHEQRLADEAELRDRFVAILGHDLRNPLGAILATATTLLRRRDAISAEARSLRRIIESSVRMSRMISQVLDFSRARFTGLDLVLAPTDLAGVCASAVDELRAIDPERPVEIDAEGDTSGTWDADRLAQVVSNLLGNAHEHGLRDTPIVLRIRGEGDRVQLAVTNRGEPIRPDQLEKIFEPFRSGSSAKRGRGLGLGLYIVKRIIEVHGGTITAASVDGTTTFTVELPRHAAPPGA